MACPSSQVASVPNWRNSRSRRIYRARPRRPERPPARGPCELGKGIRQELQLATTPPDERCQPSFGLDFQPCGFPAADLPRLYRCLLALQGQWPEGAAGTIARDQSVGGLRHNDLPWGSGVLETGRHVRGVADGSIVHAQVIANRPDNHQPGVQPQAGFPPCWRSVWDQPAQTHRGQHGPPGMVSWAIGAPNSAIKPSPRN